MKKKWSSERAENKSNNIITKFRILLVTFFLISIFSLLISFIIPKQVSADWVADSSCGLYVANWSDRQCGTTSCPAYGTLNLIRFGCDNRVTPQLDCRPQICYYNCDIAGLPNQCGSYTCGCDAAGGSSDYGSYTYSWARVVSEERPGEVVSWKGTNAQDTIWEPIFYALWFDEAQYPFPSGENEIREQIRWDKRPRWSILPVNNSSEITGNLVITASADPDRNDVMEPGDWQDFARLGTGSRYAIYSDFGNLMGYRRYHLDWRGGGDIDDHVKQFDEAQRWSTNKNKVINRDMVDSSFKDPTYGGWQTVGINEYWSNHFCGGGIPESVDYASGFVSPECENMYEIDDSDPTDLDKIECFPDVDGCPSHSYSEPGDEGEFPSIRLLQEGIHDYGMGYLDPDYGGYWTTTISQHTPGLNNSNPQIMYGGKIEHITGYAPPGYYCKDVHWFAVRNSCPPNPSNPYDQSCGDQDYPVRLMEFQTDPDNYEQINSVYDDDGNVLAEYPDYDEYLKVIEDDFCSVRYYTARRHSMYFFEMVAFIGGRVVDDSGNGISGATVFVDFCDSGGCGNHLYTNTDGNGYYSFESGVTDGDGNTVSGRVPKFDPATGAGLYNLTVSSLPGGFAGGTVETARWCDPHCGLADDHIPYAWNHALSRDVNIGESGYNAQRRAVNDCAGQTPFLDNHTRDDANNYDINRCWFTVSAGPPRAHITSPPSEKGTVADGIDFAMCTNTEIDFEFNGYSDITRLGGIWFQRPSEPNHTYSFSDSGFNYSPPQANPSETWTWIGVPTWGWGFEATEVFEASLYAENSSGMSCSGHTIGLDGPGYEHLRSYCGDYDAFPTIASRINDTSWNKPWRRFYVIEDETARNPTVTCNSGGTAGLIRVSWDFTGDDLSSFWLRDSTDTSGFDYKVMPNGNDYTRSQCLANPALCRENQAVITDGLSRGYFMEFTPSYNPVTRRYTNDYSLITRTAYRNDAENYDVTCEAGNSIVPVSCIYNEPPTCTITPDPPNAPGGRYQLQTEINLLVEGDDPDGDTVRTRIRDANVSCGSIVSNWNHVYANVPRNFTYETERTTNTACVVTAEVTDDMGGANTCSVTIRTPPDNPGTRWITTLNDGVIERYRNSSGQIPETGYNYNHIEETSTQVEFRVRNFFTNRTNTTARINTSSSFVNGNPNICAQSNVTCTFTATNSNSVNLPVNNSNHRIRIQLPTPYARNIVADDYGIQVVSDGVNVGDTIRNNAIVTVTNRPPFCTDVNILQAPTGTLDGCIYDEAYNPLTARGLCYAYYDPNDIVTVEAICRDPDNDSIQYNWNANVGQYNSSTVNWDVNTATYQLENANDVYHYPYTMVQDDSHGTDRRGRFRYIVDLLNPLDIFYAIAITSPPSVRHNIRSNPPQVNVTYLPDPAGSTNYNGDSQNIRYQILDYTNLEFDSSTNTSTGVNIPGTATINVDDDELTHTLWGLPNICAITDYVECSFHSSGTNVLDNITEERLHWDEGDAEMLWININPAGFTRASSYEIGIDFEASSNESATIDTSTVPPIGGEPTAIGRINLSNEAPRCRNIIFTPRPPGPENINDLSQNGDIGFEIRGRDDWGVRDWSVLYYIDEDGDGSINGTVTALANGEFRPPEKFFDFDVTDDTGITFQPRNNLNGGDVMSGHYYFLVAYTDANEETTICDGQYSEENINDLSTIRTDIDPNTDFNPQRVNYRYTYDVSPPTCGSSGIAGPTQPSFDFTDTAGNPLSSPAIDDTVNVTIRGHDRLTGIEFVTLNIVGKTDPFGEPLYSWNNEPADYSVELLNETIPENDPTESNPFTGEGTPFPIDYEGSATWNALDDQLGGGIYTFIARYTDERGNQQTCTQDFIRGSRFSMQVKVQSDNEVAEDDASLGFEGQYDFARADEIGINYLMHMRRTLNTWNQVNARNALNENSWINPAGPDPLCDAQFPDGDPNDDHDCDEYLLSPIDYTFGPDGTMQAQARFHPDIMGTGPGNLFNGKYNAFWIVYSWRQNASGVYERSVQNSGLGFQTVPFNVENGEYNDFLNKEDMWKTEVVFLLRYGRNRLVANVYEVDFVNEEAVNNSSNYRITVTDPDRVYTSTPASLFGVNSLVVPDSPSANDYPLNGNIVARLMPDDPSTGVVDGYNVDTETCVWMFTNDWDNPGVGSGAGVQYNASQIPPYWINTISGNGSYNDFVGDAGELGELARTFVISGYNISNIISDEGWNFTPIDHGPTDPSSINIGCEAEIQLENGDLSPDWQNQILFFVIPKVVVQGEVYEIPEQDDCPTEYSALNGLTGSSVPLDVYVTQDTPGSPDVIPERNPALAAFDVPPFYMAVRNPLPSDNYQYTLDGHLPIANWSYSTDFQFYDGRHSFCPIFPTFNIAQSGFIDNAANENEPSIQNRLENAYPYRGHTVYQRMAVYVQESNDWWQAYNGGVHSNSRISVDLDHVTFDPNLGVPGDEYDVIKTLVGSPIERIPNTMYSYKVPDTTSYEFASGGIVSATHGDVSVDQHGFIRYDGSDDIPAETYDIKYAGITTYDLANVNSMYRNVDFSVPPYQYTEPTIALENYLVEYLGSLTSSVYPIGYDHDGIRFRAPGVTLSSDDSRYSPITSPTSDEWNYPRTNWQAPENSSNLKFVYQDIMRLVANAHTVGWDAATSIGWSPNEEFILKNTPAEVLTDPIPYDGVRTVLYDINQSITADSDLAIGERYYQEHNIIIIDGSLVIGGNIIADDNRRDSLLFIVNGDVRIEESVTTVDATILANGEIVIDTYDISGDHPLEVQLTVTGGLYSQSADGVLFNRDLQDSTDPAYYAVPATRVLYNHNVIPNAVEYPRLMKEFNVYWLERD